MDQGSLEKKTAKQKEKKGNRDVCLSMLGCVIRVYIHLTLCPRRSEKGNNKRFSGGKNSVASSTTAELKRQRKS